MWTSTFWQASSEVQQGRSSVNCRNPLLRLILSSSMQQILPPTSVGSRRKKHELPGFETCVCKTLKGFGTQRLNGFPKLSGGPRGHAETEVEYVGGNWRQWNCSGELVALFQNVQADVAGALLKYTHGCKNIQGAWAHNRSSKRTSKTHVLNSRPW